MADDAPVKIDLKIELCVPEFKMCSCGAGEPHVVIVAGDFRTRPVGAKSWARALLKTKEVEFFGEFIIAELRAAIERSALPEDGPKTVACLKHDADAGTEILFEAADDEEGENGCA